MVHIFKDNYKSDLRNVYPIYTKALLQLTSYYINMEIIFCILTLTDVLINTSVSVKMQNHCILQ